MGQKHKIRYGYQTGNSYGSESLESELEMVWENLEVDKGGWFNKQKCEELLNKKQYNFVIELESKINEKNG